MTALLAVQGLSVAAPGGRRVVDDVSFTIEPGRFRALVGESGSGKTMAARAVPRLLPPGFRIADGSVRLRGDDLAALPDAALHRLRGPAIGMVFQEPMVSLNPAIRIGAQMREALVLHRRLPRAEAEAAARAMLARVRIGDPDRCLAAYPHEFSGGMRQRIMIASVMLLRPALLIADEPTTALDTLTQREVLDLMTGLAREEGTAVLLITHNLGLVARYADDVSVMREGRVVEEGPARPVLAAPRHGYTAALVDALPRRGAGRPSGAGGAAPVIEARDIAVRFPGRGGLLRRAVAEVAAVRGVSLAVRPGETVALVGGSGSGKTTFGRALLGLVPLAAGELRFRGRPMDWSDRAARQRFRLACQLVFQDPYASLDPRMRVAEIVEEPLKLAAGLDRAERLRRVAAMLEEVGLAEYGARFPHALSGGQRQRVAIARALVRDPAFVVADEPVSALDMTIQKQVLDLFARLQRERGFACLFVSHDLGAVARIADRIAVMQDGRIVEEGPRDAILDAPQHPYTRALLEASPRFEALAA
ncbi:ABC transporter ATP-binding protein [Elioraea sp.]|uniref:dipeptide ABC transporter ATP-binding protein n=1 Tax=Elioraea sp. TaxID=2185103 RepID=UPI0021DD37B4|nr:ABC transporter ATP-binding protein [Elioraea sp.]GIX08741.1 MAG: peptide ABC transporter ATP-binding protein [Elioraea sp.]